MSRYVAAPEVKTALLVGGGTGEEDKRTKRAIEAGVDIVVGTLGKVCDMVGATHLLSEPCALHVYDGSMGVDLPLLNSFALL